MEDHTTLTLVFDVQVNKKLGVIRQQVPDLEISRRAPDVTVRDIYEHLETHLLLPNGRGYSFLLLAVCSDKSWVPLVCDHIWLTLFNTYGSPRLKIVVERRPPFNLSASKCTLAKRTELKYLDLGRYFPAKHTRDHRKDLCERIFFSDLRIKSVMRRGIWMHLVGVYHPNLQTHEEREMYIGKLRRIYDALKGKWHVQRGESNAQFKHLCDSVRRDARRTDPNEEFYTKVTTDNPSDDDNIQKLVNIIVMYTLEHRGVSYTQGMTDLLSPILYVMRREEDAYICFAAMVEQIKSNFSMWCDGTLNKIERLRHLCEVLDPQLYTYLSSNIYEDAFALFFGMVLIECRREFSFDDSFHLLEVIWSAVRYLEESPNTDGVSQSMWAGYMTNESQDVVQQVFGETKSPYSAQPLSHITSGTFSNSYSTRNVSLASYEDVEGAEGTVNVEIIHERVPSPPEDVLGGSFDETTQTPVIGTRERSYTDPHDVKSPSTESTLQKSPGKLSSLSESELYKSTDPIAVAQQLPRNPTEMSDMSSVSGSTGGNNFVQSYRSTDSRNALRSDSSQSHGDVAEKEKTSDHTQHENSTSQLNSGHEQANGVIFSVSDNHHLSSDGTPASLDVPHSITTLESRLSPVAFFDTVEQLATTGATQTNRRNRPSNSSDVGSILSQLVSVEGHTPRISRQSSLEVPIACSFPLFICLAILIQNRVEIMQRRLDFVGLSVLLNAQAGGQRLDSTLKVARTLFNIYRKYQDMYFGDGPATHLMWLDMNSDDSGEDEEGGESGEPGEQNSTCT